MIIITRLELANRWSWRLEGLWEGVTILVVGGYVPNFHIQVFIDFCHLFHLVVAVDLLLCQGGVVRRFMANVFIFTQFLRTSLLQLLITIIICRLVVRVRTRELFSRSATASCLGSAGDDRDNYNLRIEDVPDCEDYGDND